MKQSLALTKILFIAITTFIAVSCDGDDNNGNVIDNDTGSIVDFVSENEDYSSLLAALQVTGLDTSLAGTGPFTVFAPNNAAFETFLNGTALEDVPVDTLTELLLNHVISQSLDSNQLAALDTGYISTLTTEETSGSNISMYVDTSSGVVLNGQSAVTTADITLDNGIIHTIDTVIEIPTLVTFATSNPALTSLVAALTDEGNTTFTDLLSNTNQDFTVFAPTNNAFTSFLDGNTIEDVDNDMLAQILSNHVVPDAVAVSTSLSNTYVNTAATFQGDALGLPLSLYVNTDSGVTLNGVSDVVIADIIASNGVVHVVNNVIGLPDITTFATADPTFATLITALTRDEDFMYVSTLQTDVETTPAPFTVFAPTNDAFTAFLVDLGDIELADIDSATLAATLELHVLTGLNVRAEDLAGLDQMSVITLNGVSITIDAGTPAIIDPDNGSSTIVANNVQATNGVIHVLDRVLRDL